MHDVGSDAKNIDGRRRRIVRRDLGNRSPPWRVAANDRLALRFEQDQRF
jgi:hypothetical protein